MLPWLTVRRLTLIACLALSGCSWLMNPPQVRGNKIDREQMAELNPGVSTKADVTAVIGSPTARDSFDDNVWIYVSETTQSRVGRMPAVIAQEAVVLNFDDQGVLRSVEKKTLSDSVPVQVVSRTTPSPGTEASFMQQLFGNIGRFNALGSGPVGGAAPGGAPRPY